MRLTDRLLLSRLAELLCMLRPTFKAFLTPQAVPLSIQTKKAVFLRSKQCPMGAGESHTHFCALVFPSVKWEEGSPNVMLLERRQTQVDKKENKEVRSQALERFW